MSYLLAWCKSLENIDLSNFDTKKVNNMENMFIDCISLKKLDLSNFNTQNVKNMKNILAGCSNLRRNNIKTRDLKIKNKYYL